MTEPIDKLVETLQAHTVAMRELTEAVAGLVQSNMELIALVADEEAGEYGDPTPPCYLDGTPIG